MLLLIEKVTPICFPLWGSHNPRLLNKLVPWGGQRGGEAGEGGMGNLLSLSLEGWRSWEREKKPLCLPWNPTREEGGNATFLLNSAIQ